MSTIKISPKTQAIEIEKENGDYLKIKSSTFDEKPDNDTVSITVKSSSKEGLHSIIFKKKDNPNIFNVLQKLQRKLKKVDIRS